MDEVDLGTRDESAKQGQGDECGGANGKALPDGGGRVSSSVQRVGTLADILSHAGHLGDAAGVVGDGSIGVNGQA